MPPKNLPPAPLSARLGRGLLSGPLLAALLVALLGINLLQAASALLLPVSRRAVRRVNRWCADTWWGWCVALGERVHGIRLEVTGDPVPLRENAVLVANHQQAPDINVILAWARSKRRLGDLKWFVKAPLRLVPGIGWGMVFLDCVFVRRDWTADQTVVERAFRRLVQDRIPFWLVAFPEGTRATPAKLEASRRFAVDAGYRPLTHLLLPRPRGFVASVSALRERLDAVYDLTIGYPDGVPTLWQFACGFCPVVHVAVRRFPIETVPADEEGLGSWLRDRFVEKDERLEGFARSGSLVQISEIDTGGRRRSSRSGDPDGPTLLSERDE